MHLSRVPIISVNTGEVVPRTFSNGRTIETGIVKTRVDDRPLRLDITGLEGDGQADQRSHGHTKGRTVYAYPALWYGDWGHKLGRALPPGGLGENLTLGGGICETDVFIGERWRWGTAILEVTGPRRPCYKLEAHLGDGAAAHMMDTGHCGWYFKVVEEGVVPTTNAVLTLTHRPASGLTVLDVFRRKIAVDASIPGPTS